MKIVDLVATYKPLDTLLNALKNAVFNSHGFRGANGNPGVAASWRKLDASLVIRKEINASFPVMNLPYNKSAMKDRTNAWFKAFELLSKYLPISNDTRTINMFDNAAFPGAFILAAHEFAELRDISLNWYASSLLDQRNNMGQLALVDTYSLYKANPDRWLMTSKFSGDVTVPEFADHLAERLKPVDFDVYTSDLGMEETDDVTQELAGLRPHIGQILDGLVLAKPNTLLVIKQYTFFSPMLISILHMLWMTFELCDVVKPVSSRATNSETYIVLRGIKNNDMLTRMIVQLKDILRRTAADGKVDPESMVGGDDNVPDAFVAAYARWMQHTAAQVNAIRETYAAAAMHANGMLEHADVVAHIAANNEVFRQWLDTTGYMQLALRQTFDDEA